MLCDPHDGWGRRHSATELGGDNDTNGVTTVSTVLPTAVTMCTDTVATWHELQCARCMFKNNEFSHVRCALCSSESLPLHLPTAGGGLGFQME